MCLRPHYGRYLLWWCAAWFSITVLTQMPECYERSQSLAPWRHTSIAGELVGFAFSRLLTEVPFALLWGSFSWLLSWGLFALLSKIDGRGRSQYNIELTLAIVVKAVLLLAALETIALGVPLASINTDWANFSMAIDDAPALTITDRSIGIQSSGILLVFPLACLIAGFMTARHRCTNISSAS